MVNIYSSSYYHDAEIEIDSTRRRRLRAQRNPPKIGFTLPRSMHRNTYTDEMQSTNRTGNKTEYATNTLYWS